MACLGVRGGWTYSRYSSLGVSTVLLKAFLEALYALYVLPRMTLVTVLKKLFVRVLFKDMDARPKIVAIRQQEPL